MSSFWRDAIVILAGNGQNLGSSNRFLKLCLRSIFIKTSLVIQPYSNPLKSLYHNLPTIAILGHIPGLLDEFYNGSHILPRFQLSTNVRLHFLELAQIKTSGITGVVIQIYMGLLLGHYNHAYCRLRRLCCH